MIRQTQTCRQHQHPEFRLTVDPKVGVEPDVDWFLRNLEDSVAQGKRYADGETFQIGSMFTLIRSNDDGTLSILEPDMIEMPVKWVDSISWTLAILRLQKDVVESVLSSDDMSFPSMLQSCIVCNRLKSDEEFVLDRTEPAGLDSGWFAGCRGDHDHQDPNQLERTSLFEAVVKRCRGMVSYLALPEGILVGVRKGTLSIFQGENQLEFRPGSYLHCLYGGT